jgi:hypothetical protein
LEPSAQHPNAGEDQTAKANDCASVNCESFEGRHQRGCACEVHRSLGVCNVGNASEGESNERRRNDAELRGVTVVWKSVGPIAWLGGLCEEDLHGFCGTSTPPSTGLSREYVGSLALINSARPILRCYGAIAFTDGVLNRNRSDWRTVSVGCDRRDSSQSWTVDVLALKARVSSPVIRLMVWNA